MAGTWDLSGQCAVVTGAGRGIGRAIALAYARAGADLAICSRTQSELHSVRAEIENLDRRCFARTVDLADPGSTQDFCCSVLKAYRSVNILVNNAGAGFEARRVSASDPDLWWKTKEVNLRGPYLVTRFLLEGFSEGGKIINLSSGMGKIAGDQNSAYSVSKAALHIFTEALANELWPRKIDVNNLIPGPVATSIFDDPETDVRSAPEEVIERFKHNLPPGFPAWENLKHPDHVAELALFLATMPVGGPTGQTFSLARRPI